MNTLKNKTIRFRTVKCPDSSLKPGVTLYRANVVSTGTKKIKEIADDMFKGGCNCQPATIGYVLQFFADNIADMIAADGCRRSLGELVTLYPSISGNFTSPDAEAGAASNPVYIKASCPKAVRKALEGVSLYNVSSPDVNPTIASVFDIASDAQDKLIVGSNARITGKDLLIVDGRADEGVWLKGVDNSVELQLTLKETKSNSLDFVTPAGKTSADIPNGAYTLTVKTRAGRDASMTLCTRTRAVSVVTAA